VGQLSLVELRTIGWADWDPIGLASPDGTYPEGAKDEYDSYLLESVHMLTNGASSRVVTQYLIDIATDHMGLGVADRQAAEKTVLSLSRYLASIGHQLSREI
jgi:hypothetical protein